jgi:hypothetical protein
MALSLGVSVVHIITGQAEDLMSTLITANSGGRTSAQITVAAISSFPISFSRVTKPVKITGHNEFCYCNKAFICSILWSMSLGSIASKVTLQAE